MAGKRITKAEARRIASQNARARDTNFHDELAAINAEFTVTDTASYDSGSSYGGSDSGSSYGGSDSGSTGGGCSGSE